MTGRNHGSISLGFQDTADKFFSLKDVLATQWLYQWVWLPAWGFSLACCSNYSSKMHHFCTRDTGHIQTDGWMDRRMDR